MATQEQRRQITELTNNRDTAMWVTGVIEIQLDRAFNNEANQRRWGTVFTKGTDTETATLTTPYGNARLKTVFHPKIDNFIAKYVIEREVTNKLDQREWELLHVIKITGEGFTITSPGNEITDDDIYATKYFDRGAGGVVVTNLAEDILFELGMRNT
jgi:hypothetical protein